MISDAESMPDLTTPISFPTSCIASRRRRNNGNAF